MAGFNDFGRFFLEDQPRAAFLGQAIPFAKSPFQKRTFPNLFDQVFDQFLAQIAQQAQAGQLDPFNLPRFGQFVGGVDPNALTRQLPRFQRGASSQFFNPRTRFLFGF